MEKIILPSAEEFLKQNHFVNAIIGYASGNKSTADMLIAFAKLHVEAALKEADDKAEEELPEGIWDSLDDSRFIINSYTLENIK